MVAITREGTVHVNERQVEMEGLQDVLRRMLAENTLGEVVLIADDPQAGREVAALADEHGWSVESDAAKAEGRWRVRRD